MKILTVFIVIFLITGLLYSESRDEYEQKLQKKRIGIALFSIAATLSGLALCSFFTGVVLQNFGGDMIAAGFYYGCLGGMGTSLFFWPFGLYLSIKYKRYTKRGLERRSLNLENYQLKPAFVYKF